MRVKAFAKSKLLIVIIFRMVQKVKLTDKGQLEKEKKEKGFTLYVNGANDGKMSQQRKRRTPNPSPREATNTRLATGTHN